MHLIAATKLQEGARILNFQEVSLSKLIKNFNDEALGLYTKEKNIKIKFDAPCDYIIKADPESFTQVLRNLVTNAIKYSPPKSTPRSLPFNRQTKSAAFAPYCISTATPPKAVTAQHSSLTRAL